MNLKPEHKEYILEHENDIRDSNWKNFFKPGKYPHGIGEPLYLSNIPFMQELRYIPTRTFEYCSGLTSVTIPKSVTEIGDWAFNKCAGLTSILIPESVTSIGSCAFVGCTGLTSITIPSGVTEIGFCAFYECSSLKSVTIPNSVTTIYIGAFAECPSLTDIAYDGTTEQWKQIYNESAFRNTCVTVNCTDGKIVIKRK